MDITGLVPADRLVESIGEMMLDETQQLFAEVTVKEANTVNKKSRFSQPASPSKSTKSVS